MSTNWIYAYCISRISVSSWNARATVTTFMRSLLDWEKVHLNHNSYRILSTKLMSLCQYWFNIVRTIHPWGFFLKQYLFTKKHKLFQKLVKRGASHVHHDAAGRVMYAASTAELEIAWIAHRCVGSCFYPMTIFCKKMKFKWGKSVMYSWRMCSKWVWHPYARKYPCPHLERVGISV